MVSWGLAWPFGKILAGTMPLHVLLFWRFFITTIFTFPYLLFFKIPIRLPSKKDVKLVFLGGLIYSIYNAFFFEALLRGLPGAGGVLVTTLNPVMTYFLVSMIFRQKILAFQWFGLALGILGGAFILKVWQLEIENLFISGNIFFLLCSISWAILSLVSQKAGESISPIAFSFYVALFSTFIELPFAISDSKFLSIIDQGNRFWISMFYVTAISTAFGTTIYYFAATKLGSNQASSFIFLVPTSAYVSSYFLFGEDFQWNIILGGFLAIFSVIWINKKRKRT